MKHTYIGKELDLFAAAGRWKSYVRDQVAPYVGRDVLEVGAGQGGTTRFLIKPEADRWVCLEPDPSLADALLHSIEAGELPRHCAVRVGTQVDLDASETFDTLLYIDVLEHIEHDRAEVVRAAARLRPAATWLSFVRLINGSSRRLMNRSDISAAIPSRCSGRLRLRVWIPSAWPTSMRSACSPRWATNWFSAGRCRTLGRSPCGTRSWSPCRDSSTPFSVTPWVNRCWGFGGSRSSDWEASKAGQL